MKNFKILLTLLIFSSFSIITSCSKEDDLLAEELELLDQYLIDNNITTQPTSSGLYYIENSFGMGSGPTPGKTVVVHYTGYLIDGTKFDSSYDRGEPFTFTIGAGQVIKGWDEGIAYMREGGDATLIIPSDLGYGSNGACSIPGYSTLVFDVRLITVY